MNNPAPIPATSWLSRVKDSEPVRLYTYSLLCALLTAAVTVGWLSGEWDVALGGVAAALLGIPGAEAARASVYSPRTHNTELVHALVRARGSWAVSAAEDAA